MSDIQYGVIFDVDGVLVDSYRAHLLAWQALGRENDFTVPEDEFAAGFGRTSREVLADKFGPGVLSENRIRELDERKEELYREMVVQEFPTMHGVKELLNSLHAVGIKLGVGSSGPPPNVFVVLDNLGQKELFSAIVTGADVIRGKPDPQVFLLGAERLGLPPNRCLVFEDAVPGVQAAKRAGMKAIGIASTGRRRSDLHEADLVIDKLTEANAALIKQLIDSNK
jgi:beta-phosphoglucomutase